MCVREHVLCLVKSLILKLVKYFEMSFLKNRKGQTLLLNMSFDCQEYEQSHTFYRISIARLVAEQLKSFLRGSFLKTDFRCSSEQCVAESS